MPAAKLCLAALVNKPNSPEGYWGSSLEILRLGEFVDG